MMTGNELIQQIKLALDKYSASSSAVIGPAFLDSEIMAFANQAMVQVISTKFTGNNELALGFEDSVKRISDLEHITTSQAYMLYSSDEDGVYTNNMLTTRWDAFYSTDADGILNEDKAYDLLYVVRATLKIKQVYVDLDTGKRNSKKVYEIEAKPTTHQHISKFVTTPTNKPYIPYPMYVSTQIANDLANQNRLRDTARGFAVCVDPVLLDENSITNNKDANDAVGKHIYEFNVTYVFQPQSITESNRDTSAFGGAFKDTVLYEIINKAALLMLDNIESERLQSKAALNKTQE